MCEREYFLCAFEYFILCVCSKTTETMRSTFYIKFITTHVNSRISPLNLKFNALIHPCLCAKLTMCAFFCSECVDEGDDATEPEKEPLQADVSIMPTSSSILY